MRLRQTTLIAAVGFGTVWIAAMASCNEDDPDNLLTTNATDMMMTVGGSGGTSTDGGGGAGADGGTTSQGGSGATGGQGGQGGEPEQPIHGCLSTTATDLTGLAGPHTITVPGTTPICIKIADGETVDFNVTAPASHRLIHGTFDTVKTIRVPPGCLDTPQTNCPNWVLCTAAVCTPEPHYCTLTPPFNCVEPPPTGPLNKVAAGTFVDGGSVGAFPFFDDKDPTIKGVVYVE